MDDIRQQIERLKATIQKQEAEQRTLYAEVHALREEIAPFEARYDRIVQPVVDRVSAVEAAIEQLRHRDLSQQFTQQATDSAPKQPGRKAKTRQRDESLKQIYRRLARLYHPDLATDDADRERRNRLMAQINDAYAEQDKEALLALDQNAPQGKPEPVAPDRVQIPLDVLALRRLQQTSADLATQIADLKIEHHDLMYGTLMDLKIQEKLTGKDVLGDLAKSFEKQYWDLMKQLDLLRKRR